MVTSPSTVGRPDRVRMHALAIACLAALLSGLLFAPAVSTAATSSAHWSSARADALPAGAVARWSFDDQTDPTGDDVDGHDADVIGASFDTQDVAPTDGNQAALRFDGNDYAEIPDPGGAGNLDGFDGLTIAAWVNPSRVNIVDGGQMILSKYHSADPQNTISYWFLLRGDEIEVFVSRARDTNEARRTSTSLNLTPGQWVHVAGTWDGSQFRLFANGEELAGTTSVGGSFPTEMDDSAIPVNIGSAEAFAGGERASFFHGLLDDVYLFDRALTGPEVASLSGVPDTDPPAIEVTAPEDGAAFIQHENVNADYACSDVGSGVASCIGTVPDGDPIDTSTFGDHTFLVESADTAGNQASVSHHYSVGPYRPDAMIRLAGQSIFTGNDIRNTTGVGQKVTARLPYLGVAHMTARIENEGVWPGRFLLRGTRSAPTYSVRYFVGPTEVTQAIKDGTYRTPLLAPGEVLRVKIQVSAGYSTFVGDEHRVELTASSVRDATIRDRVIGSVKRTGFDPIGEVIDACATSALVAPRCFGDPFNQLSYTYGDTVILLGDASPLTHGQVTVWRKVPFGTQWHQVGTATIARDGRIFWTWRTSRADVNGFDGYRFQFRIGPRGYSNVVELWVLLGE